MELSIFYKVCQTKQTETGRFVSLTKQTETRRLVPSLEMTSLHDLFEGNHRVTFSKHLTVHK